MDDSAAGVGERAGLCERVMRTFADLWSEDACTDLDIAVGLAMAQAAFRRHSGSAAQAASWEAHAVLVVPMFGEPHILGGVLASVLLERVGCRVNCDFPRNRRDLERLLDAGEFSGMALVTSGVFSRLDRIEEIRALANLARRHALPPFRIAVYGHFAGADAGIIDATGTDCVCGSATELARYFDPGPKTIN